MDCPANSYVCNLVCFRHLLLKWGGANFHTFRGSIIVQISIFGVKYLRDSTTNGAANNLVGRSIGSLVV